MSVVIVGGGLAGAAAACALAAAGQRPLVIERHQAAHDKVCGEFLSVETVALLRRLGIEPLALGGTSIGQVRLIHGATVARAALPFAAIGLSRRVLDEALLARAAALGAVVERGRSVGEVGEIAADTVFVAAGKHRLRGVARPPGGGLAGFKQYYRLTRPQAAALGDAVELVLFRGGYAGLQQVEGGYANLCLVTKDAGGGLDAAIAAAPHLVRRLAGAEPRLARPLAIANLPYGMVHRASPADAAGQYRLGDQWGMIPSFTGDGMALALTTALMAAAAWRRDGSAGAAAYHARAARVLGPRLRLAARLAEVALWPGGGPLFAIAGRAAPALLATIARATRVPAAALHSL